MFLIICVSFIFFLYSHTQKIRSVSWCQNTTSQCQRDGIKFIELMQRKGGRLISESLSVHSLLPCWDLFFQWLEDISTLYVLPRKMLIFLASQEQNICLYWFSSWKTIRKTFFCTGDMIVIPYCILMTLEIHLWFGMVRNKMMRYCIIKEK